MAEKLSRSDARKKLWADPEYRARVTASIKKSCSSSEFKSKMSFIMEGNKHRQGRVCSEETKKKMSEAHKGKPRFDLRGHIVTEETRSKISESQRGKKFSDEHKKKLSEAHKGHRHSDETRRRMSDARKNHTMLEETREKLRAVNTGKRVSEESKRKNREAHLGRMPSSDTREKLSKALLGRSRSADVRKKISESCKGDKNHNWKGGYYPKKYCFKFNEELKAEIREEHNHKCFLCSTVQMNPGLSIHHIDYNYNAGCKNTRFALLPLCSKCHPRTNYNRWHWFNLLINYWAINPEINFMGGVCYDGNNGYG